MGRARAVSAIRTVCVFCGSRRGRDSVFADAARELGRALARAGLRIIYGGGEVGLMGILAEAALAAGGEVVGVIPEQLLEREVAKRDLHRLVVTRTMFARKAWMIQQADAFIALPGGFGTLDELLEVLTLKQLGYHRKPIVLLEVNGFWKPCLALFDRIMELGFAPADNRDLYRVAEDLGAVMETLQYGRSAES